MSKKKGKNKVGTWIPDLPDKRDYRLRMKVRRASALPQKVDLRLSFPTVPVLFQGNLGSCTAAATSSLHMACQVIGRASLGMIPSKLFIYYNARAAIRTTSYDSGAMIRDAVKSVVRYGVCPEPEWPYNISRYRNKPSLPAYRSALNHQVLVYERLEGTSIDQILTVLAAGFPIVFGFSVYSSFDSTKVARTGLYLPDPSKERVEGGHAVAMWGYDKSDQTILVKNSWGTRWGMGGFFKMRFSDVTDPDQTDDFWVIRVTE